MKAGTETSSYWKVRCAPGPDASNYRGYNVPPVLASPVRATPPAVAPAMENRSDVESLDPQSALNKALDAMDDPVTHGIVRALGGNGTTPAELRCKAIIDSVTSAADVNSAFDQCKAALRAEQSH